MDIKNQKKAAEILSGIEWSLRKYEMTEKKPTICSTVTFFDPGPTFTPQELPEKIREVLELVSQGLREARIRAARKVLETEGASDDMDDCVGEDY